MESESFTQGGAWGPKSWAGLKAVGVDEPKLSQYVQVAKYRSLYAWKLVARALFIVLVIMMVVLLGSAIPIVGKYWETLVHPKSGFTQKEGLQYLGASADVIRGDYENNQDSLAEKALKQQMAVTDMALPPLVKSGFGSREHLTTPEEELMQKMNK